MNPDNSDKGLVMAAAMLKIKHKALCDRFGLRMYVDIVETDDNLSSLEVVVTDYDLSVDNHMDGYEKLVDALQDDINENGYHVSFLPFDDIEPELSPHDYLGKNEEEIVQLKKDKKHTEQMIRHAKLYQVKHNFAVLSVGYALETLVTKEGITAMIYSGEGGEIEKDEIEKLVKRLNLPDKVLDYPVVFRSKLPDAYAQ